jgi:hypothetical protein
MDGYPAGISASHWRAAIRAQLARPGIRKDDLERCGVSVASPLEASICTRLTGF